MLLVLLIIVGLFCYNYKKTILKRDNKPYLIRYTIFTCKEFSIKIHKVLVSDIGPLHDHPWDYISIILYGGYKEETATDSKWYSPLSVLVRKANISHKLLIPIGHISVSLVITSKKYRAWGYN